MRQVVIGISQILMIAYACGLCMIIPTKAEENESLIKKEVLSLKDCIEIAKANNPSIIQARDEYEQYRLKVKQQYAAYFPQITLSTSVEKSKIAHRKYDRSSIHNIKVEQDIFTGGENSSLVMKAKADLAEKEHAYKEVELDQVLEVKKAYYQILKERRLIQVQKKILERRKKNADLIKLLYNAGREKRANLHRAEAEIAKAVLNLSKETDNLHIYILELNKVMGREIFTPLTVKGTLQSAGFQSSLSELINEAEENRPELNQQQAKIRAASAELKEAYSGLLPNLTLESNYGVTDGRFLPYEDAWDVQLKCNLNFFDGLLTVSEIEEAAIEIDKLQVELDDLEKEIAIEVNQAYLNLLNAQKQLKVSEQTLRAIQVSADLSRLEYKQGTLSYTLLDDEEVDLTRAELDVVDALYDVNLKKAELDNIIGR